MIITAVLTQGFCPAGDLTPSLMPPAELCPAVSANKTGAASVYDMICFQPDSSSLFSNFHLLFEQNIILVCDDYSKNDNANQAIWYKR